jgi:hypothetical protein
LFEVSGWGQKQIQEGFFSRAKTAIDGAGIAVYAVPVGLFQQPLYPWNMSQDYIKL